MMSKTDLAKKANISPGAIMRIEQGMSHRVETQFFHFIC